MRRVLLLLAFVCMAMAGFAVVTSYNWSYSTGTYQEISGGTQLGGAGIDDTSYSNIALPFTFTYDGVGYTAFSVNANGFIAMGTSVSSSYTPLSTGTTNNVIAALSRDIKGRTDADLRWQVIGDVGSRQLVVQWKNYARYQSTITVTDNFNFQIRLLEGSNQIQFHYGSFTVDPTDMTSYPQVGLRGAANTDYKNRTTTTNWAATTPGGNNDARCTLISTVYPVNGSVYSFTQVSGAPYPAELVSPATGSILIGGGSLYWTPNGGVINGYKIYLGRDGAGMTPPTEVLNGTDLGNVTSYATSGLIGGQTYYWQIVPYNTVDATGCPIWSFQTAIPLTGTKIIGPNTPYDYLTFTEAINALNASGVGAGGVTFNVQNSTFNENPPAITTGGSAGNPVIFQPVTGANPVLAPAGGTGTFGFKIQGADYVTFDNIDINGPNTLIYGYWVNGVAGNGATYNTIKNCSITVPYGTTTNYGVYVNSVDLPNNYTTIQYNTINNPYSGIYLTGSSTAGNEAQQYYVANNTLSGIRNYGVYMLYGLNGQILGNQISFFAGGTTAYYGVYVGGSTSTYTVTQNLVSSVTPVSTSGSVYGYYNSSGTTTFSYNEIYNTYNTSSSAWYGFYAGGGASTWLYNQIGSIANTGTAAVYAAYITTGNHTFQGNTIADIATGGTSLYGLYVIGGTNHTLNGNKIYNLRYTGTSTGVVYGIHVASGTTNSVYNNMVYDLRAPASTSAATAPAIRAFSITSGTTDNIWNNSVYLNATGSNAAFSTAALYVSASTNTIDLKNNIFVNESVPGASGRSVAFWKTTAGVSNLSASSDKNIYYTVEPPTTTRPMGYFSTTTYTTLADYKAMTVNKDQASFWEDVPFVSTTRVIDLHLDDAVATRAEGNAIPIQPPVTMDVDNETRNDTTPDIGADEGDFTAVGGAPGQVTLLTPADGATGQDPISLVVTWSPPGEGGTPLSYYVFVSTQETDFFDNQIGYEEVPYPGTSLDLATISGLEMEPLTEYFWAVQAHNNDGDSDPDDPAFQIWSFTTMARMTAPATLAFGNVWPQDPETGTIPVTNHGPGIMTFNASGPAEFVFGGTRYSVPAYSTYNLPYTFTPPAATGAYSGQITLTETDPGTTELQIPVTANVTTDVIVGTGTTDLNLPIRPFYKTSYSQSIYYPSEISYPAGYRINKIYYYYNGFQTWTYTGDFVIYMGHTATNTFATTTSWLPISGFQQVYAGHNVAQLQAGGYWMEFTLDTPFVYDGVSNLVIAVEENVITSSYDSSSSYFYCTDTPGINRSIQHQSDTLDADPASPPTATALKAGYPNLKLAVGAIPTTPVMAVTPDAWDYGTQVIFSQVDKQFTIRNTGGGTLSVSGITYAGDTHFQLLNLPEFPVNLGYNETTTFTVRYLPTAAGTHTGTVSIADNRSVTTVDLDGVCVDPRISSLPHTQNFDGVATPNLPLGWTGYKSNAGMTITSSTGYSQTTPNSVYMTNSTYTTDVLRLISPQVLVPMNTVRLSFWALTGTAGTTVKVGTVSAIDGTGVFTELATYTLPSTYIWYNFVLPFTAFVGTDQYICFQHGQNGSSRSIYIDSIQMDALMPVDLGATAIAGPGMAQVGVPASYNVSVYNNGTATQNAYTVYLKRGTDTLATLAVSDPIAPGATAVHTLSWTPLAGQAGANQIFGQVMCPGDGNAVNDVSPNKAVYVVNSTTYMPTVGDPLSTTTSNSLPLNMYWKNSVTETIYTAREMQMTAGTIDGIVYYNNFTQNLPGKPVKIWVKNTIETNLTTSWLPFTDYTLVFDGVIDFPIGINAVIIPFTTPYVYTGANLAVRVNRPMDIEYFNSTNTFYYTVPQYDPDRCRNIQSDTSTYDPTNPGLVGPGTLSNNVPVTTFLVSGATPVVLGSPDVTITVNGTNSQLDWPLVPGAYAYRIYASDDPYNWPETPHAVVWTNTYSYDMTGIAMKCFKVVAVSSYRHQTGLGANPAVLNSGLPFRAEPSTGYTNNKD